MKRQTIKRRAARRLLRLHAWQLCLLLIPLVFISATLLRANSLGMVERRAAVLTADKAGDQETIRRSLADLQSYVSGHMNAGMGKGVYLQDSYTRAYDAALASAADTGNPNSAVYQRASVECRSRYVGTSASFRNDYVQCVVARVSQLAPQTEKTARLPLADDYRFDFVSPLWSPDAAGIFTALTVFVAALVVIRTVGYVVFRLLVRRASRRSEG